MTAVTEPPQGTERALQDVFAPNNRCFGCGPANDQGLRIKSHAHHDVATGEWIVTADFTPAPHHLAFDGIVNGGILGALLDCHSNWTAAHRLMVDRKLDAPPCTVTGDFHVKLKRPTPMGTTLHLRAKATEVDGDKVVVEATIEADVAGKSGADVAGKSGADVAGKSGLERKVTATCLGTFIAVREGHPAYHRW